MKSPTTPTARREAGNRCAVNRCRTGNNKTTRSGPHGAMLRKPSLKTSASKPGEASAPERPKLRRGSLQPRPTNDFMDKLNAPMPSPTAPCSATATQILDRMKSKDGLTNDEAETFVALLHKLDRIRLAEVSGYALGLAISPRRTVIHPDHEALRGLSPNISSKTSMP